MSDQPSIAFIGLGVMGYPVAGYLARQGYETVVYNRTTRKADRWLSEYPGVIAVTPEEAAKGADIVFCCVGNDDDLRQITTGPEGVFMAMKPGAVFIDHTTTSANIARELSEIAAARKLDFIDAPLSGGQVGAENGRLTIMCGGSQAVFDRVARVMGCYSKSIRLMGGVGSGQLTKMVNQICIAGIVQGLSEGLHFAKKTGLDVEAVVDVIAKGAAQSWQMENRYKTMMTGDYNHGFAVDLMRKDLGMCLNEAEKSGSALPLTALIDQFYKDVQVMGGGRWDATSLLARLEVIAASTLHF
ncbi:MAG: NAD(P)-dependent oxidoreductase [Candidatus Endonucleobacter bathymodioli]|uniref:NAD(P)-dependent oxidoreductase n=1 Tax=Candidatus Endonucleibacter bathymodioli TaxID=539814 RepID=A0AA90NN55_9GAMM|nr:NAD(P)-dependent oxidoreductase [Candidatus Endonucleobacter bathymodioli]